MLTPETSPPKRLAISWRFMGGPPALTAQRGTKHLGAQSGMRLIRHLLQLGGYIDMCPPNPILDDQQRIGIRRT
jgi:hypothetical protein